MKKIRLGDIATLITKGTTPTTIGFSFVDTGVNFVKIESISENGEFLSDKFAHITDECDNKLKRSQLEENDILFSIAGAIGRTAIVPRSILPANTNQALAIIRIPQNAINLRFVLYALQSQAVEEQSEKQKQGVAQLNLSLKNIADILIPLVSSEKQDEIVRNLAAVDTAIAIRKEQIRLIDQVVKSRFIELFGMPGTDAFGWGLVPLGSTCNINPKKSLDSRLVSGAMVSFVPMPAVTEHGEIDATAIKEYDEVKTGFTYFAENDVLFAKITP
ncbi:MAG: restriction endonuclease subunit S, partial [Lactiplantibacillus plantarum]